MSPMLLLAIMVAETVLVGAVYLLYPWIVRKGLLFGVYVGEEVFDSAAARALTRLWYRGMAIVLAVGVAVGAALALAAATPVALVMPVTLQTLGFLGLYLWAYRRARRLAPAGPPPAAVAPLAATLPPSPLLPALTMAVGVACGAFAIAHAWAAYDALPASVPIHFDITGEPDAWRPKSIPTVMLLPAMALVLGIGLGGLAWLTANAKRGLRRFDQGASLAAQMRFRTAMTRFLSGTALLTSVMLTAMSVSIIRVGLGRAPALGRWEMALAGVLVLWAIGGTVYLSVRYGQGGSRLENANAATPLTNGIADNRNWVLGMFYVNRNDPSILVERRFGLGYTLNFGNWKAAALFAAFTAAIVVLLIVAATTS
ncbi:MAG: DUF1648 domain-containing protein [Acidobacteria bacterium]|nr:DUF1648 domain-containing protein [Acidobacteriota bacterium]